MKILVTGGTGVIGAGAVPALLRAGHTVRLLSRHAERDARAFSPGVEPLEADLTKPGQLARAVVGCDAVVHIAGIVEEEPPELTFEGMNVGGTRHLLEAAAAAGAPWFVFLSSLGAERGESDYHRSKLQAEELVKAYCGRWLILRAGNVYGPGDETISMLLKMIRTLPAVPVVDQGNQPFQPIWYSDIGDVIAQAVVKPDLGGRILELAGPDVTTTDDVLNRMTAITGCTPARLEVPAWVAQAGAHALEAFGAAGKRMLERAGLGAPINSSKLSMLLEWSAIPPGRSNALGEFEVAPTTLDQGLKKLADLLPEQMPGKGVGALKEAVYLAQIRGSRYAAAELLDAVCERITEVMPIEFAAEPGAPRTAVEGVTMTAEIEGRGKVQVRLEERTRDCVTFVTLEGHPLAGVMQLKAKETGGDVTFSVHTIAQPANILDWFALRTVGEALQKTNWLEVVRRVVTLSRGEAPEGLQHTSHTMTDEEARELEKWVQRVVQRRQRMAETAGAGAGGNAERA